MIKNDCGIYIDGYELFHAEKSYYEHITVKLGCDHDRWGYAISMSSMSSGMSYGLADRDLIYASRSEAVNKAIEKICNNYKYYSISDAVANEIIEKLKDSLQLDLFGDFL